MMFSTLSGYIESYASTSLSETDRDRLEQAFIPTKFAKGQFMFKKGEVCRQIGFLHKGAIRLYMIGEKGQDHIVRLAIENWWVGDLESFTTGKPSLYYSEVLEPSEVLLINLASFRDLQTNMPAFAAMLRVLDEKSNFAAQKRIYLSQLATAEEKYTDLKERYPAFLQRFSQKMIAAYLGISPETLSRVRKKDSQRPIS